MGRKRRLELTRVRAEGRPKWRKIYHGKMFTFRGDYDDAVKSWHRKLVELEADPPQDELHEGNGRTDGRSWRSRLSEAEAGGRERSGATEEATTPRTIAGAVDAFLVRQRARASAAQISAGRYANLQRCVKHFAQFIGGRFGVDRINGAVLEAYHTSIMEKVGNGWSPEYAQSYMAAAKQFVRWLDHNELIDRLPRNIGSKDLGITIPPHKIKTFAVEEIRTLLAHAPERTRLFLLLMLNIGATQKDISDLRPDEVDWEKGRIVRKRSKTRNRGSVPTIEYPLWRETFDLLRKYGERDGERVLRTEHGGALKVEELRGGKVATIDNIAAAYHWFCTRLKRTGLLKAKKPLKLLRKTSPSLLQKNPLYAHCAAHFLGHAPHSIADRHYISIDQLTFDKAVLWLGEEYGVR